MHKSCCDAKLQRAVARECLTDNSSSRTVIELGAGSHAICGAGSWVCLYRVARLAPSASQACPPQSTPPDRRCRVRRGSFGFARGSQEGNGERNNAVLRRVVHDYFPGWLQKHCVCHSLVMKSVACQPRALHPRSTVRPFCSIAMPCSPVLRPSGRGRRTRPIVSIPPDHTCLAPPPCVHLAARAAVAHSDVWISALDITWRPLPRPPVTRTAWAERMVRWK